MFREGLPSQGDCPPQHNYPQEAILIAGGLTVGVDTSDIERIRLTTPWGQKANLKPSQNV